MKKIVIIMLVAMVPYFTMAQKRSKKNKKDKTAQVLNADATYEFMVITGYEMKPRLKSRDTNTKSSEGDALGIHRMPKMNIIFDFGRLKDKRNIGLLKESKSYKLMASAVNAAAIEGWEFISANVLVVEGARVHYYYMRRDK